MIASRVKMSDVEIAAPVKEEQEEVTMKDVEPAENVEQPQVAAETNAVPIKKEQEAWVQVCAINTI